MILPSPNVFGAGPVPRASRPLLVSSPLGSAYLHEAVVATDTVTDGLLLSTGHSAYWNKQPSHRERQARENGGTVTGLGNVDGTSSLSQLNAAISMSDFVETSPLGLLLYDAEGIIVECKSAAAQFFEPDLSEIVGHTIRDNKDIRLSPSANSGPSGVRSM